MQVQENYDLTSLNTFGVKAIARYFVEIHTEAEIPEVFALPEFVQGPVLFLGGGSNILFTRDWPGIVVLNHLKGIEIIDENGTEVFIRAFSGEVWHDLVNFAVERGYWGIENLSFIPGSVGGAPMQNIGAYGAELRDTLESVETYILATGDKKVFTMKECDLGYRDSIFKNSARGKYFIGAIVIKLSKNSKPNTTYRALQEYIEKNNITDFSIQNISSAVIAIRKSKLPDPKVIGNAGSFFKNVFIDEEELRELQQNYPDIPNFREPASNDSGRDDQIKIPAGWLIEARGWKGKRVGNVGVHDKQALVIVNHGGATGKEIKDFADQIISSVQQKFGLTLTPEVNFV